MSLLPGTSSPFRNAEGKISVPKWDTTRDLPVELHASDREIKAIVDNQEEADRLYNALPESKGGKVINTDIARGLLPAYAESREGRIKYTLATATAAKVYAADRIHREIENRGDRKKLMFTAGGVAAGKSTVVDDDMVAQHDLVFDGTMRDTAQAIKTIHQALDKGWDVRINYVQRPIELVIPGAIDRANTYGRWGTIGDLPAIHADAQRSIIEIAHHFSNDPRVKIRFWLNDGRTKEDRPKLIALKDINTGGHLSLSGEAFLSRGRAAVDSSFRNAVKSGKYDHELLKRLAGNDKILNAILHGHQ
jgi:RNAse (barnase) inhibitor barstar